jgi:hypothetical protein
LDSFRQFFFFFLFSVFFSLFSFFFCFFFPTGQKKWLETFFIDKLTVVAADPSGNAGNRLPDLIAGLDNAEGVGGGSVHGRIRRAGTKETILGGEKRKDFNFDELKANI